MLLLHGQLLSLMCLIVTGMSSDKNSVYSGTPLAATPKDFANILRSIDKAAARSIVDKIDNNTTEKKNVKIQK